MFPSSFPLSPSFQRKRESPQLTGPLQEIPAFAGMTGFAGVTNGPGVTDFVGMTGCVGTAGSGEVDSLSVPALNMEK